MRRKNMLALGISFVLGVGASSTLAYARAPSGARF